MTVTGLERTICRLGEGSSVEQITEKGSRGKDWKEDQSTGQNLKTKQLLTKLTESTPKMEIAGQSACHASPKN